MSKIIMINGHSVTFDVENSDASDPHHAPFDEALVEKILNGATVPNAPAMLDMAANTDTFDFDVPYSNKWVLCCKTFYLQIILKVLYLYRD